MRPILVFAFFVTAAIALGMFVFQATRRTYSGLRSWSAGAGAVALGYLMLASRGVLPDALTIVGGGALWPLGLLLHLDGLKRFLGLRRVGARACAAVVMGVAALLAVLHYGGYPPHLQPIVTTVPMAAVLWMMAAVILRASWEGSTRLPRFVAVLVGVGGTVVAVRGALILGAPGFNPLQTSTIQLLFFPAIVVLHIAMSLSMILLHLDRVEWHLRVSQAELEGTVRRLEGALSEVKELRGILPICSSCKQIRTEDGRWEVIEVYVHERSRARFSHGLCPSCARKLFPEVADELPGE